MEDKKYFISHTASTSSEKINLAERPEDLSGKIIGMIDNTKEQADVILEALGEQLKEKYGVSKIIIERKDHYSKPAPDKMIEDMSREVDVAIAALGG